MTQPEPADPPWRLIPAKAKIRNRWRQMRSQIGDEPADQIEEFITTFPRQRTERNKQLRGSLAHREYHGRRLDVWQYEITGAARLRYLVDDAERALVMVQVDFGHPKDTE